MRRIALFFLVCLSARAQWLERGPKIAAELPGGSRQGSSVALSADGSTLIESGTAGAWVFARSASGWTQQTGQLGAGGSVAVSADGNTVLIGSQVFVRTDSIWSAQAKLAADGDAVALSADGNTALVGSTIFTRTSGIWNEAREKPEGSGAVALSGDGNTAVLGGQMFQRAGRGWIPFAKQLTDGKVTGVALSNDGRTVAVARGTSVRVFAEGIREDLAVAATAVALSADGARLIVGTPAEDSGAGAAREFRRTSRGWQPIAKLRGAAPDGKAQQGYSVALSGDGHTAAIGGPLDAGSQGAVWIFADPVLEISPIDSAAAAGRPVTFQVIASDPHYAGALHFTSSDRLAALPADAALTAGAGTFQATFYTAGAQTVAATDGAAFGKSAPVTVQSGPAVKLVLQAPPAAFTGRAIPVAPTTVDRWNNPAASAGALHWSSSDRRAILPKDTSSAAPAVTFVTTGRQTVTVTVLGNPALTGSAVIALTAPPQFTDYVSTVLSTNPVAYFRLEAANDTSQVGGYTSTFTGGATLSSTGAPICEPGNSSVTLDGSTGVVTTTLPYTAFTGTGSLVAWVSMASTPPANVDLAIVAGFANITTYFDLDFYGTGLNTYMTFYIAPNQAFDEYKPNSSTLLNQWHMMAGTYDESTQIMTVYWDGQQETRYTGIQGFGGPPAGTPFNIGAENTGTKFARFFDGGIDEVAMWNYALTPSQVQTIYNSATCPPPIDLTDNESVYVADHDVSPGLFDVTSNPCDVNGDGSTDVSDVQTTIDAALGLVTLANPFGPVINVTTVQIVINSALGTNCIVN